MSLTSPFGEDLSALQGLACKDDCGSIPWGGDLHKRDPR